MPPHICAVNRKHSEARGSFISPWEGTEGIVDLGSEDRRGLFPEGSSQGTADVCRGLPLCLTGRTLLVLTVT